LLGQGDVLRISGKIQEAVALYSGITIKNKVDLILMRKAMGYMEIGQQ